MASYTTLRNGSTGSDVKKLQQALIDAGYDVGSSGADGIYGAKTKAAVTAYQKANGLSVDGIAGNQTLGSLYATPTTTNTNVDSKEPTKINGKFVRDLISYEKIENSGSSRQKLHSPFSLSNSPLLPPLFSPPKFIKP